MMKYLSALLAGLIFGIGLTLSQMTNPEKVLGFLDWFGQWDATLVFVMGGAVITTLMGYPLIFKSAKPLAAQVFDVPTSTIITKQLVMGSALFGIGWGISGYCPGPALANFVINTHEAVLFMVAMLVGFVVTKAISK